MKRNLLYLMAWVGCLCCFTSCQKVIKSQAALYQWVHNDNHGLIKKKTVGQVRLSMKYLPPELLVSKELRGQYTNRKMVDSLLAQYKTGRTFLLNLTLSGEGDKASVQDILYKDAHSYGAYKQRVMEMNFNMAQYIRLKAGDKVMKPVIANMENTYSLTKGRNIYLVFAGDEASQQALKKAKKLDITFTDQLFETGIHHFVFDTNDLDNIPQVSYLHK
ncbi:hypothetical protein [Microscilla marina]|nr:hypothetical protein [Microscilla marina]